MSNYAEYLKLVQETNREEEIYPIGYVDSSAQKSYNNINPEHNAIRDNSGTDFYAENASNMNLHNNIVENTKEEKQIAKEINQNEAVNNAEMTAFVSSFKKLIFQKEYKNEGQEPVKMIIRPVYPKLLPNRHALDMQFIMSLGNEYKEKYLIESVEFDSDTPNWLFDNKDSLRILEIDGEFAAAFFVDKKNDRKGWLHSFIRTFKYNKDMKKSFDGTVFEKMKKNNIINDILFYMKKYWGYSTIGAKLPYDLVYVSKQKKDLIYKNEGNDLKTKDDLSYRPFVRLLVDSGFTKCGVEHNEEELRGKFTNMYTFEVSLYNLFK